MEAERATPWLEVLDVEKHYGGVLALNNASLQISAGEVRGLVGANGAGKSTLVKILTGLTTPTSGEIRIDGQPLQPGRPKASLRAGIVSVPQELTVAPHMTVAENVLLGHYPRRPPGFLRQREMRRLAQEVLTKLELPLRPNDLVGNLSIVFQRLVMVARAFSFSARLMIFDEPTAAVSPREVEFLLEAIKVLSRQNVSILYVSHRLDEVVSVCGGVTVLGDGSVVAELKRDEMTQEALVRYLTAGSKQAARDPRANASVARDDVVLELRDVQGTRLHSISLVVRLGEIVGVAGVMGSGTRELLLTVAGALPFTAGSITLAGKSVRSGSVPAAVSSGIGFLPGERSIAMFPTHSIRFNVSLPSLGRNLRWLFVDRNAERSTVQELLDRVALRRDPGMPISSLSGGNQQRALVARWLGVSPKLLLLDDPTAGVDIATRPELHEQVRAMCAQGAGVLLLSTDLDELVELSDRVIVLSWGRVNRELSGDDLTASRVLESMTL